MLNPLYLMCLFRIIRKAETKTICRARRGWSSQGTARQWPHHAASAAQFNLKRRISGQQRRRQSLRPSTYKAHAKCAQEDQEAGIDSLIAAQVAPAGITQKVLGEKLDQRRKGEQASRDGIHDTHKNETNLGVGAVEGVRSESNSLSERRATSSKVSVNLAQCQCRVIHTCNHRQAP